MKFPHTKIQDPITSHWDLPQRPFLSFNGTILKGLELRQDTLHNRILIEETQITQSIFYLFELAKQAHLYQLFPANYLDYLIMYIWKKIPYKIKLTFKNKTTSKGCAKERINFLLTGLTLIYTKEEKYIPNSTINIINHYTGFNICKKDFFPYYQIIAKTKPDFYKKYPRNKKQEFLNCFRYTLTQFQRNGESNSKFISIHKQAYNLTKKFVKTNLFQHTRPDSYELTCKVIIDNITCKIHSIPYTKWRSHSIPFNLSESEEQSLYQKYSRIKDFLNWYHQQEVK